MNNNLTSEQIKYQQALKSVKRIKGFYSHLMIYLVINSGLLIAVYSSNANENFWRWQTFSTVLCWGIGLVAHGLSVFLPGTLLGKNWEQNKINELMEREKNNKWE